MGGRSPDATGSMRLRAGLAALAIGLATLVPLTWPEGRDSFPLSPYPMFSGVREDTTVTLVVAIAEGPGGTALLPTEATGHRHLTQAVKALAGAVSAGGDRPARLCAELATWAAHSGPEDAERVRIVTAAYDGIDYLVHGERTPRILAEHVACEVSA